MLTLSDLPNVMDRREGWHVAARLMRRWFAGTAAIMSEPVKLNTVPMTALPTTMLDETIVTMEWVLRFARVKSSFDTLVATGWRSDAGRRRLRDLVRLQIAAGAATGIKPGGTWRFGDLSRPAKEIDTKSQVNIAPVGAITDAPDDFYGAIGRATLKIAVAGTVKMQNLNVGHIAVDTLGVYLRDTYEFIGDQPLGLWSEAGVDRSRFDNILSAAFGSYPKIVIEAPVPTSDKPFPPDTTIYAVANNDFYKYRERFKRGGDFVVLSDVRIIRLAQPVIIEI